MASPAAPGLFFCFAAMVLLLFVSVSPPVWQKIYFLKTTAGSDQTIFGVFGECLTGGSCTSRSVGYDLNVNGSSGISLAKVYHGLTYTLILHPIAGFLALLAFLFGLIAIGCASRICTFFMMIFASLGLLVTLVIFVIDMVLWILVRNRTRDAGYSADLGNANWLTLGALVALILATCASFLGMFGRFASGRMAGEKY